ncbi:MAG: hypothetical protein WKF57_06710 [Nakamurella sp.]
MTPDEVVHRIADYIVNATAPQTGSDEVKIHGWDKTRTLLSNAEELPPEGTILSRADLRELASRSRDEPNEENVLRLFWSVLAWGSAPNRRSIERIVGGLEPHRSEVVQRLIEAQQHSFAGDAANGFRALRGAVKNWGPAFFTKFLAFTSNPDSGAGIESIILDDRVRVALLALTDGTTWYPQFEVLRPDHYEQFCSLVGIVARASSTTPEDVEIKLFMLGQRISSYTVWLEQELRVTRELAGQTASREDVLIAIDRSKGRP